MKDNFRIIFIVFFLLAAVVGLIIFSGVVSIGNNKGNEDFSATIILWGTQKTSDVYPAIEEFNRENKEFLVKYEQKYPETFDLDLLEALASGKGPDLFFLTDDLAYKYSNKIFTIPYQSFPLDIFRNTFVGAAEVFLTSQGIIAFPLTVDPIVLYYNRSLLDANDLIYPPANWEELVEMSKILTVKDEAGQIIQSGVALGQFNNIKNAKNILATLFLQIGNPLVQEQRGVFRSVLDMADTLTNTEESLKFYTSFSNPAEDVYSWNRSLVNSQDFFSAGNLAFYFGYSSELQTLVNKNPNQNLAVTSFPQIKDNNTKLTSAKVTGLAIAKSSKNFNAAFQVASLMTTGKFSSQYSDSLKIPPARRDLLSIKLIDVFYPTFYSAALYARSWVDPSFEDTDNIFRTLIENVLSNNLSALNAVKDASAKLNLLLIR